MIRNKVAYDYKGTVNIYFMRHGKTILNTLDRVQGRSDSPLTDEGIEVVTDTAYGLADIEFDFLFTSDKLRARETAGIVMDIIPSLRNVEMIRMKEMREMDFGNYEGNANSIMWAEIMKKLGMPDVHEFYKLKDARPRFIKALLEMDKTGQAESFESLIGRLTKGLGIILATASKKENANVLVVSHGGAISTLLTLLSNESIKDMSNAAISQLQYKDGEFNIISAADESYKIRGEEIRKGRSKELTIHLMCSGKTIYEEATKQQGWAESDLSQEGIESLELVGESMSDIPFDAVYTSDFCSAIESAKIVLEKNKTAKDLKIVERKRLRNVRYGRFECYSESEMTPIYCEQFDVSNKDELIALQPSAKQCLDVLHYIDETEKTENWTGLSERVLAEIKEIARTASENGNENILVVSHQMAIATIVDSMKNVEITYCNPVKSASIVKITYKSGNFA